jgi:hypothetical protein
LDDSAERKGASRNGDAKIKFEGIFYELKLQKEKL